MKRDHQRDPVLEVRDLRLVCAIAREGGMARAAHVLHVTQSALSHHLRALEARVGVPLFERVGRRVVLNAHGARVVALADRIVPELLEVEDALRAPPEPEPAFRITMGCYTCYPWLPSLITRLARDLPSTRCEVNTEVTRRAAAAVLEGEIDAAVVPNPTPHERLRIRHAFDEEIVIAMRPDDPLASLARIPVARLADRTVYSHDTPVDQRGWFLSALGKSSHALRGVVRVPLTEAIIDLVRAGTGVAILGSWTVARDVARGELVTRPIRPSVRRSISVITARDRGRDPRADVLTSVLTAAHATGRM